jgi:hypothetical protein
VTKGTDGLVHYQYQGENQLLLLHQMYIKLEEMKDIHKNQLKNAILQLFTFIHFVVWMN